MALVDILEALRHEAQEEIASIERARDAELETIKKRTEEVLAEREIQAQHDRERRAHKIYERIISKARHQVAFIETKKQQEKIAAVLSTISGILAEMDATTYEHYLAQHWNTAHTSSEAEFHVATERAPETRAFLTSKGIDTSRIVEEQGLLGGYRIILPNQEIDRSFVALMNQIQSQELSRINHLLSC